MNTTMQRQDDLAHSVWDGPEDEKTIGMMREYTKQVLEAYNALEAALVNDVPPCYGEYMHTIINTIYKQEAKNEYHPRSILC